MLKLLLVLVVVAFGMPPGALAARSAATCPQFAGKWSTDYGMMWLHRHGSTVAGTYHWNGIDNAISGTLKGKVLAGRWSQPHRAGWFRFAESSNNTTFAGSWGAAGTPASSGLEWMGSCV